MRPRSSLITALFFFALAATPAFAKNVSVGIYAVVDEVTFEPQGSAPNLIRISGVFVVPVPISSGLYRPPQRGYLYFRLRPGMEQAIRKDWSQLKAVAGTGQVVGFAQYWVWVPPNPNDRLSNMYHSLEARVRTRVMAGRDHVPRAGDGRPVRRHLLVPRAFDSVDTMARRLE